MTRRIGDNELIIMCAIQNFVKLNSLLTTMCFTKRQKLYLTILEAENFKTIFKNIDPAYIIHADFRLNQNKYAWIDPI